jgi:Ser/Thr protein kinase RdoA (MazF antagonist)
VISRVLAAYPLLKPTVVERFEANYRNDNWLIEDEGSRRYVLRRHRQHTGVGRIAFQLNFQQHLHRHGFPTPQVVETREGRAFVLSDDGVPWALFAYVDGGSYEFGRMRHVVEAARRLAQFHNLAETFDGEDVIVEYAPPIRFWWMNPEEDLEVLKGMFGGAAVDEELAYVRHWWQWVLAEWPPRRIDDLPVGWVHGDYHGRNMVFVDDEMRALFDFDDLNRGPMVFDVARGVHMFGRESRGSLRIRLDVARLFVEEYARGRVLTSEERSALPMMVAMYYPPNARYYLYCQQLGEDLEARLRREVSMMRVLQAQMPQIASMIGTI